MQFLCYGSLGFNRLIPLPPTIPFQPPHLFSNLSPHRPCSSSTTHTSVFQAPNTMYGHDCQPRVLYLLKRCQTPAFSNLAQMTRTRRGVRPVLCDGTVGAGFGHLLHISDLDDGTARHSLVQHDRRHHHDHVVRRADILSTLDGALNLGDFHVIAPGTPRTGDWMEVWRDSVSAERQKEAYEPQGSWEWRVLPG
ncbi:hypothetical protein BKA70DRAFT_600040 [Coprinopsis sp. MPI-PUGE-AT-0042]|nr:hypothetical protein BKA70DRAFT_600040 [Coprinopsis sp. MPI-PUGE-AT-0042]